MYLHKNIIGSARGLITTAMLLLTQGIGGSFPVATPSDLYLGLYSDSSTKNLTVFQRDNFQHSCVEFPSPNTRGLSEECKYYGDCCTDPMRIREKLEPGTFSCQTLPSLGMYAVIARLK